MCPSSFQVDTIAFVHIASMTFNYNSVQRPPPAPPDAHGLLATDKSSVQEGLQGKVPRTVLLPIFERLLQRIVVDVSELTEALRLDIG